MKNTSSLNENTRFKSVYHRGISSVKRTMVVYAMKNRTNANRLGITASTKVGNAVKRNRMRRRLKEVYRLNEDKLGLGMDIVIVARRACLDAPFENLIRDFVSAMAEISSGGKNSGEKAFTGKKKRNKNEKTVN